jgi:hypothetical protein
MKLTKFVTVYVLQGNYGSGWEDLTCDVDRPKVYNNLLDYRENEGTYPLRIVTKKVLRDNYNTGNF